MAANQRRNVVPVVFLQAFIVVFVRDHAVKLRAGPHRHRDRRLS